MNSLYFKNITEKTKLNHFISMLYQEIEILIRIYTCKSLKFWANMYKEFKMY